MRTALLPATESTALTWPATTLPLWLRQRARQWPDAAALIDGVTGSRYSHAALHHLVGRCAAGLSALGFGPGAVLLMVAPNAPEWAIAALAALAAGGAVSAAHPASSATELTSQLRDTGARFVFTTPALLATVRVAGADIGSAGTVQLIVLGEADASVSFTTLLACADAEPRPTAGSDSLALWLLSPATARHGPGQQQTHRAVLTQLGQIERAEPLGPGDVTLSLRPMSQHEGFVRDTLSALAQGAAVVTLPSVEPTLVRQTIARHGVTRHAITRCSAAARSSGSP